MKQYIYAIDIDGVITANPQVFEWLTYHLKKNENNNYIYILSWRNGSDEKRLKETMEELRRFNISYDELIMAKNKLTFEEAAYWKILQIKAKKVDVWIDDEIKAYQRDLNIDLDLALPEVQRIWI